jgi:hypothetical protein
MNAFLQLIFSPRNVKVTPVERTPLLPGEQLPLTEAGRSFGAEAELQISPAKLARIHGRISRREGKWRLSHSAEDLRTFVNGTAQAEATLQHLDVLELPDHGPVFRFLTSQVSEGATAAVKLDDPARLAVWADTLLEANDPLGDRIARLLRADPFRTSQATDDLRWLGPLARTFIDGRLEVQWRNGLLRRAVLRDLAPFGSEPLTSLALLLKLPVARFLEELTVDAGGAQSNAQAFVEVLRHVGGPRSLRVLHLGDVSFADAWAEAADLRYRKLLQPSFPALAPAALFGRFRRAFLTVERAGSKAGEQPGDIQELGESAELIDIAPPARGLPGTIGVAFWRLQRHHAHWELEAVPSSPSGITLNGRPVFRAVLRDGDQIELSTGVAYRFRLER